MMPKRLIRRETAVRQMLNPGDFVQLGKVEEPRVLLYKLTLQKVRDAAGAGIAQRVADAARFLLRRGDTVICAQDLAWVLWPSGRSSNAHGQVFNLSAGAAGRLLRRFRVAEELPDRQWRLVPEYLEGEGPADERPVSRVRLNKLKTRK